MMEFFDVACDGPSVAGFHGTAVDASHLASQVTDAVQLLQGYDILVSRDLKDGVG